MTGQITNGPESRRPLNGAGVRRISGSVLLKDVLRVGTWNVRSLYQDGKFENALLEMNNLNISILGISEARWPNSGRYEAEGATMYYSGNCDGKHKHGVAVMMTKDIDSAVTSFLPVSERCMLLQIKAQPTNLNIIQVYAPTAESTEDDIENFYADLDKVMKSVKAHEVNILMGDFNAKVGKGRFGNIIGDYGLGNRNDRGDRLVEFCEDSKFVITNTWFQLPNRRLYTWKSPQDTADLTVRNQIDYILINERFRNAIISVKTYPGADIESDHNPVLATLRLKLKRTNKKSAKCVNLDLLQSENVSTKISKEINDCISTITQSQEHDIEKTWSVIRKTCNKVVRENLFVSRPTKKKTWMTQEIIDLIIERRTHRNRDASKYKILQKEIRRKVRTAKTLWMKSLCKEAEDLDQMHDSFHLHKKVREITQTNKTSSQAMVLYNPDGAIVGSKEEKIAVWKAYVENLFSDERNEVQIDVEREEAPHILTEEVLRAIRQTKNRKSPGPDGVNIEIVKLFDNEAVALLAKLFNSIYNSGIIPSDWLKSIFIPLPKKTNAKSCKDFRTISLMSHALKIFLRIIHARIWKRLDFEISFTQFGFRNALGTREALFSIRVLIQKCMDRKRDVYACFIDFEKAFDNVKHEILIGILERISIDFNDIRIIKNLYWEQCAQVRVENSLSEETNIYKGVRQGCILSPLLFNVYSEFLFKEALENCDLGIKVNGVPINNIRYADDTVLIADNPADLQTIIDLVVRSSTRYGLKINTSKTKVMVFRKEGSVPADIRINTEPIEQVKRFRYLGQWMTEDASTDLEVKTRIEMARSAFNKMRPLLCNHDADLQLRWRLARAYVLPVLLYGIESWTLKVAQLNRLEAFELWMYRRILKIPWTAKVTNTEVMRRMNKEREILHQIKVRKTSYLGHVLRNPKYELLQIIMMGKIEGRRGIGRKRASWLLNIRQWTGIRDAGTLFHIALDRKKFSEVIANLR